jgi:hypothetical protein
MKWQPRPSAFTLSKRLQNMTEGIPVFSMLLFDVFGLSTIYINHPLCEHLALDKNKIGWI